MEKAARSAAFGLVQQERADLEGAFDGNTVARGVDFAHFVVVETTRELCGVRAAERAEQSGDFALLVGGNENLDDIVRLDPWHGVPPNRFADERFRIHKSRFFKKSKFGRTGFPRKELCVTINFMSKLGKKNISISDLYKEVRALRRDVSVFISSDSFDKYKNKKEILDARRDAREQISRARQA